ncbi:hypothetical protein A8B75_12650 [Sphingomonadales bacterium EhC05]|nr:hypothetical protein A8B75_12650 [Sphingomonadales bacterium EhC05]
MVGSFIDSPGALVFANRPSADIVDQLSLDRLPHFDTDTQVILNILARLACDRIRASARGQVLPVPMFPARPGCCRLFVDNIKLSTPQG